MHFITRQTHFLLFSKAILLSFHFTQTSYTLPTNISPWPPHDLSQNLLKKARGWLDNDYSSKPDLRASQTGTGALPALKTSNKNLCFTQAVIPSYCVPKHITSYLLLATTRICQEFLFFTKLLVYLTTSTLTSSWTKPPKMEVSGDEGGCRGSAAHPDHPSAYAAHTSSTAPRPAVTRSSSQTLRLHKRTWHFLFCRHLKLSTPYGALQFSKFLSAYY